MKSKYQKRDFWLVQRMTYRPIKPADDSRLARVENVFGYGRAGDYALDYMGSAEFEWGGLGESWERFRAGGSPTLGTVRYKDVDIELMWIGSDPDARGDFLQWAAREFETKDGRYEIKALFDPEAKYPPDPDTVWWDITGDVMFARAGVISTKFLAGLGKQAPQFRDTRAGIK